MSPGLVIALVVVFFLALTLSRAPIAFALAASGALGLTLFIGIDEASAALGSVPFGATASFSLVLVPMFVLMGMLVLHGGLAADLFEVARWVTRRFRAGLGLATVGACAAFAAVTGSSIATVAIIGRLAIREMIAANYSRSLAAGIVAAAGTLGVLIPPSIVLVIYGILAEVSIGALLIAGIVPGILTASVYGIFVVALVKRETGREVHGGGHRKDDRVVEAQSFALTGKLPIGSLFYLALLFMVVVGGLYLGLYTSTEAGAMGASTALVLMVYRALRHRNSVRVLIVSSLKETAAISSMVFALLVGGAMLALFLVRTRAPFDLAIWSANLDVNRYVVVIVLLLLMIPLGMVLDPISIMLIVVPLAAPAVMNLGFSGVWFGILMVKVVELALVTPPLGINAFVVSGVSDQVTVQDAFRGVAPFVVADAVVIAIILAFPGIVTFLPELAGFV